MPKQRPKFNYFLKVGFKMVIIMKILRKKLNLISLLMSFIILFASCSQYDDIDLSKSTKSENISGKELFKGIFLVEGEYSKKINYFQPLISVLENEFKENPELKEEKEKFSERIVNQVNELNPLFFNELKNAILSNSINEVESTLEKGAKLMQTAIYIENKDLEQYKSLFDEIDINNYDLTTEDGMQLFLDDYEKVFNNNGFNSDNSVDAKCLFPIVVVAVAIWVAAVLINVVAGVNVAAWVFALYDVVTPKEISRNNVSTLEKEKFITQITFDLVEN